MRSRLLDDLERLLARGLKADARHAGSTEATARILLVLSPGEAVPMGDVADRVGRDASTATRFVDRAVVAGLARREPGLDRRRRLASLTAEGEAVRSRLLALRSARAAALPGAVRARTGLGEAEVEWFLDALVDALGASAR